VSETTNRWADIDDAGYWHAPEAEEKPDGPAVTDDISQEEKKEEPLVKLSSGTFIEPSMGFGFNKQCKANVKVDYLDESARNMKKVNFSLFSKYLGKTANLNVSKDGYEQDGYAEADVTLYYPSTYDEDKDGNVKYFFRATHRRGEKAVDSIELNMPQPLHFVELKKDDYDENGADKYNKEKDGDNYKEKQVVTELQKNLVTLGFLADSKDATDGYFGDTTDTAVREFQDYAIKTDRMKRSKGKIEQADKALDQSGPDGIVGKKTADEIDLWLRKDWVKPEITLRHGEYDDTGVQNGKGNKGTDDHHKGTPVVKAQENLQNVGVYKEYNVDGWFHDHMYESLKRFQEAAAEGKFLINNVLTDIGEKLTGHVKGSYCPKTRTYLEKVTEKNGVVPDNSKIHTDWKQGLGRKIDDQNKYNNFIEVAAEKNVIDPFILKSLIAQESGFNPKACNNFGYAGLTQIGGAAIKETNLNIGNTKKIEGKWEFDFDNDERFDPQKAISAGAKALAIKIARVDNLIFSKYTTQLSQQEKIKFYLAAYNCGEGTVVQAVKLSDKNNPTWDEIINRDYKEKSCLWSAINPDWGTEKKYIEITEYVDNIIKRKE
jgi:peptidoglycan hydrolase-like protein with peptidoglycan-binding domain